MATSDESEGEATTRPKKKKKRKRRDAEGGAKREGTPAEGERPSDAKTGKQDPDEAAAAKRKWRLPPVWLVLLALGALEIWIFGRNGHIEVCVAREGVHDFALLGTPRNDENTHHYPTCESRLNIGITSRYTEAKEDAIIRACQRANVLLGKEMTIACAIGIAGWQERVTTAWCPPWHDHYYQRLLWFLQPDKEKN